MMSCCAPGKWMDVISNALCNNACNLGSCERWKVLDQIVLIASNSNDKASLGLVSSLSCNAYIITGPLSSTKSWVLHAQDLPNMFQMLLLYNSVLSKPVDLAVCMTSWHRCFSSLLRQKGRLSSDSVVAAARAARSCWMRRLSATVSVAWRLLGAGTVTKEAKCAPHLHNTLRNAKLLTIQVFYCRWSTTH